MAIVTTIFVLPTEDGMPPRAVLGQVEVEDDTEYEPEEVSTIEALERGETMATFSNDAGCWVLGGAPLPEDLSKAISDHAASLGVPGFD